MRDFKNSVRGALKSRVVWFNAISGALEIANALAPVTPPGVVTAVNVLGNVALRFVTTEPLAVKGRR